MFTEQFFDLLLDFGPDWVVKDVRTNLETNEVDIDVEYFGREQVYDYAPLRRWRHLDTMQFKTFINCRLPRLKTVAGEVKTITPPWAGEHERHSYLFEALVIDLLQASGNQTRTARLVDCTFDIVNRIMHRATERGLARRAAKAKKYKNVGIDEKSFRQGHSYVTVLSDPESGSVLEVVEERTKAATCELIVKGLTKEQRAAVETVSMDMWEAFQAAVEAKLPKAQVVHDKFHLMKYLNDAIDRVRRREVKDHEVLKQSRYALLKNEENLTDKQRVKFEQIRAANCEVSRAWQARENFKAVFANASFEESAAIFQIWHESIKESGIEEVIKVAKMFAEHLRGVLNAMTSKLSNAMAERLNGKIQLLKSIGRGYRKFENFRSAILFFYGNLDLSPLNSQ